MLAPGCEGKLWCFEIGSGADTAYVFGKIGKLVYDRDQMLVRAEVLGALHIFCAKYSKNGISSPMAISIIDLKKIFHNPTTGVLNEIIDSQHTNRKRGYCHSLLLKDPKDTTVTIDKVTVDYELS